VNIIQPQAHDLAGTESIVRDELKHGIVSLAHGCRAVDGCQKSPNRCPGKRTRKTLPAIDPWRVDLRIQTNRDFATCGQEAKHRAKVANGVLKGGPADTMARAPYEPFHLLRGQPRAGAIAALVIKKSEEL
jgi:hypothetical protein